MSRLDDTALLQAPIQMAMGGFDGILKVWDDATVEVKNMLINECDILFQCRYCQNIFRSLINFISHKRGFCRTLHGNRTEVVPTQCPLTEKKGDELAEALNVDLLGAYKGTKKAKGLLKRLNLVGILNKRFERTEIESTESKYDVLTLPRIEKAIPETTFNNGVQVFTTMPEFIAVKEKEESNITTLVIPQDHCVQYLDMNLRRRENNQKENCAKEISEKEVFVMDLLERLTCNLADFGSMKCLHEKCRGKQPFASVFILAYHISVKHNHRQFSDNCIYCFVCGASFGSNSMLVDHLVKAHEEHHKQHLEFRLSQIVEKEQKKTRKPKGVSQNEARPQHLVIKRARSLSPFIDDDCDRHFVEDSSSNIAGELVTDQSRSDFLCSKSDQNLEKSDDDEVIHSSDDTAESFEVRPDQAIVDCVSHLLDLVCDFEFTTKLECNDCNPDPKTSFNVDFGSTNEGDERQKNLLIEELSNQIQSTSGFENKEKVEVPEDDLKEKSGYYGTMKNDACNEPQKSNSSDTQKQVEEAESSTIAYVDELQDITDGEENDDRDESENELKRGRKPRSDKGKKRLPKNKRKLPRRTTTSVVKKQSQPSNKPGNCMLKRNRADFLKLQYAKGKRQLNTAAGNAMKPVGKSPSDDLTSNRERVLRRKTLEEDKSLYEVVSGKPNLSRRRVLRSDSTEGSSEIGKKRMRIDVATNSQADTPSGSKSTQRFSNDTTESLRRRYRRFSHQCLPISAIDVVLVPRRKAPNAGVSSATKLKESATANANTGRNGKFLADALKKTGSFLRRSYLNQKKEEKLVRGTKKCSLDYATTKFQQVSSQTSPSNSASFMDPSSIPVYMTEAQNKAIFSFITPDKSSDKVYRCKHCMETFENEMDSRKHVVAHLRIIRLRCSLCGCCSFFCSDMRTHLQMRYCEKLDRAPSGMVARGKGVPCMTYNQADSLIEVAVKEKPGRIAFTSGKIISTASYKPYYPDPATEKKILESTSLKEMTDSVP